MSGAGKTLESLRFSRREIERLSLLLALSLAAHLFVWGGYEIGRALDLWRQLPLIAWLHRVASLPPPVQNRGEQLTFVDVSPEQATTEAPKNTKYYSSRSSRAANPEAKHNRELPQLNGKQTEVAKTENVPRPDFNKLQPTPMVQRPENQQEESQPTPTLSPGDLTLGKPIEPREQNPHQQSRPRTLEQALARQGRRPLGIQMRQEGGVRREALVPSFDVKATPFGAYDQAFIDAVTAHWYSLLDKQGYAQDRTGKVVLRFHLNYDGRISDVQVLQNTVGDLLGYICQAAVTEPAPYASWPSDMRRMIGADYRVITFTFYYY